MLKIWFLSKVDPLIHVVARGQIQLIAPYPFPRTRPASLAAQSADGSQCANARLPECWITCNYLLFKTVKYREVKEPNNANLTLSKKKQTTTKGCPKKGYSRLFQVLLNLFVFQNHNLPLLYMFYFFLNKSGYAALFLLYKEKTVLHKQKLGLHEQKFCLHD